MNHARGRDRLEARSLGRGARTLIGIALTLLLLAMQAQFVAGAKSPEKDKKGGPPAESTEAPGTGAPAEELPAEEPPPAEEAPAEEAPAEEAPAEEAPPAEEPPPVPEPSEDPPADEGGDASEGGGTDAGTEPDGRTDPEDPAADSGAATSDDDGEGRLRRLNGFRAEKALAQPPEPQPDTPGPPSGGGVQPILVPDNPTCRQLAPQGTTWNELKVEPVVDGSFTSGPLTVTVDVRDTTPGQVFDWTSNIGLDAVFVKGGSNGNLFLYNEATGDTSLHAPVNPTNSKYYDLSHISFCYDVEEDEPDVTISKSADFEGEELLPGGTVTYTITVTNDGTGTAEDVSLSDDLDDALEDVTATPSQGQCSVGTGSSLSCSLGDIDQGDSVTVTITATVPDDFCGELTNRATVGAENDSNTENNESETVKVTVECQPDVGVEKSAVIEGNPRPGETFDFVITVTNVGTGTAEDVVLTDLIQAGLAIEGTDPPPPTCTIQPGSLGETVTCNLGDLEQGDSVTVTITVTVEEDFCGPIENTAEITSPNDSNSENDSDTIEIEAVCQPDVAVSKSAEVDGDDVDEVPSGSSFTYVITVTNEGTGTVEAVTLSDDLDDSLQNVTATPSQGTCLVGNLNTLSCILGDIEQGASVTITIEVDVPADFCGELLNRASVQSENDTNRQNDQTELVIVDVPCGPDIDVRKTNDADDDGSFHDEEEALHEADPVTFRVVITNTGNVAIHLDTLVDEYEGISISPDCLTSEGENVLGMTLQPGESVTCFFTVEDYAPEPNGEIIDVVTVTGVDEDEETVSDFDDSTVTTPEVLPEPPIRPEPPAPPAPPILPVTGAEMALMGLVALGLVLAGIVLSYLGRKEDEPGT